MPLCITNWKGWMNVYNICNLISLIFNVFKNERILIAQFDGYKSVCDLGIHSRVNEISTLSRIFQVLMNYTQFLICFLLLKDYLVMFIEHLLKGSPTCVVFYWTIIFGIFIVFFSVMSYRLIVTILYWIYIL